MLRNSTKSNLRNRPDIKFEHDSAYFVDLRSFDKTAGPLFGSSNINTLPKEVNTYKISVSFVTSIFWSKILDLLGFIA